MQLARHYLAPPRRGIEIGASAIAPFPGVRAFNIDQPQNGTYVAAQQRIAGRVIDVHAFADAAALPLQDESIDFVLASHVIEHMPDTLRALREWDRVVKVGGIVFLIVPHALRTDDHSRRRTDWQHHLADHALCTTAATDALIPGSHYHVWETGGFVDLLERLDRAGYLRWRIETLEDVDSRAGNGFTVVVRKLRSPDPLPPADPSRPVAFHQWVLRLPFQAIGHDLVWVAPGPEPLAPAGLPRGTYRVTPIHDGFPPAAGVAFERTVGEPVAAPVITRLSVIDSDLFVEGTGFHATTWLETRLPDGSPFRLLPFLRDGRLHVDMRGFVLPDALEVWAVNEPPGGGAGPAVTLRAR